MRAAIHPPEKAIRPRNQPGTIFLDRMRAKGGGADEKTNILSVSKHKLHDPQGIPRSAGHSPGRGGYDRRGHCHQHSGAGYSACDSRRRGAQCADCCAAPNDRCVDGSHAARLFRAGLSLGKRTVRAGAFKNQHQLPAAQQILHNVLRTSSGHCVYRAEQQSAAGHAGQYRCNGSHLGYSGRAVHQCDQFFRLSAAARFCQSGHSGDHAGRGCFQLFCRQAHPPVAISASGRRGRIPAAAFVHRQARQKQRACKGYPHFRTEGMASGAVGAKPRTVPRFCKRRRSDICWQIRWTSLQRFFAMVRPMRIFSA